MVIVCCVCHKSKSDDDSWAKREISRHETLSHGYCPQCAAQVMEEIERSRKLINAAV